MNRIQHKWCDVTDWWEYTLNAKQRKAIAVIAIIAVAAILVASHWL